MGQVRLSHLLNCSNIGPPLDFKKEMQQKEDFNFDKISALTGSDQSAIDHFTELFLSHTLEQDWVELNRSVAEQNSQSIKDLAHKIKASFDLYSMRRASVLIRIIESSAFQSPESYQKELIELNHLLTRIGEQMKSLLQG